MKNAIVLTTTDDTEEISALLGTLNVKVVEKFVQRRTQPHTVSFLGPGKIDEVAEELKSMKIDFVIVNGTLKPSQHHFLEMKFQKECIDRSGVILRIFADHAHTPEAIAQVTLAKLRYEVPFLREWIHKAKSGDRPGFLAGGAYATDVYYEHAKTHARRIEKKLKELSKQREITRTKRRATGYSLVSLSGYTNAGKSAILNKVCGTEVRVDDKLFSTLSTTTRRIIGVRGNILMTDTVGFIKNLPPDFIDAFSSTLEEIFYADLILLVFDVSEDDRSILEKLGTSMKILLPKIEDRALTVVGNKTDLITPERKEEVRELTLDVIKQHHCLFVSASTGEGLDILKENISKIQKRTCSIVAELPILNDTYHLLSRIRGFADVSSDIKNNLMSVQILCKSEDSKKIVGWLEKSRATSISVTDDENATPLGSIVRSNGKEGAPLSDYRSTS